jgi:type III pantothenate kinase
MILAIDAGNTNIDIGGFVENQLKFVSRISSDTKKTEDEFSILVSSCLSLHEISKKEIEGVIVSSVVPPLNSIIKKMSSFLFGIEPLFVGPGIKSGIGIQCDSPSSVGADIISAAVAANYIYGSPSLIIDIGTATKMTVVNKSGAFIGTSIIPGVLMGLNALSEATAQLPKISIEPPKSVIAKNTTECMRSGVVFGNASMIDGMIDRINEEFGENLPVYATGGLASTIVPYCKKDIFVDEHLVLKGLNILYHKNK